MNEQNQRTKELSQKDHPWQENILVVSSVSINMIRTKDHFAY
jgi:hypothetical protein